MKKRTKILLIISACLIFSGMLFCAAALMMGFKGGFALTRDLKFVDFSERETSFEKTRTEEFHSIEADGIAGDIEIILSDGCFIEYTGHEKLDYIVEDGVLKLEESGGKYLLSFDFLKQKIKIYCPQKLIRADIESDYGDILSDGIDFDEGRFKTDMGDIALSSLFGKNLTLINNAGDINLSDASFDEGCFKTDMGDIALSSLSGKNLTLENNAGDINLSDASFENIETELDFGNLTAKDVSAERIVCKSGCGNTSFEEFLVKELEIESDMGDVNISGDTEGYELALKTDMGRISLDEAHVGTMFTRNGKRGKIKIENDCGDIVLRGCKKVPQKNRLQSQKKVETAVFFCDII